MKHQQIFTRETYDDYDALTLANIIEKHGNEVISVCYVPDSSLPWRLWCRRGSRSRIDLADKEYSVWRDEVYGKA